MKSLYVALLTLILTCSVPGFAQVEFLNSDGMFNGTSLTSGDLSLDNSQLVSISGFTGDLVGYNTTGPNLGVITFTTGALLSTTGPGAMGLSMVPLTGQTDTFDQGGMFKVKDTFNGGFGGFVFKGTFQSGETWMCAGTCTQTAFGMNASWTGKWSFLGTLTNATLTIDGQQMNAIGPIVIQSTTATGTANKLGNKSISFTDAGGSTNFGGQFQVSPEPGTLVLFGTGLIALGGLTKRKVLQRN